MVTKCQVVVVVMRDRVKTGLKWRSRPWKRRFRLGLESSRLLNLCVVSVLLRQAANGRVRGLLDPGVSEPPRRTAGKRPRTCTEVLVRVLIRRASVLSLTVLIKWMAARFKAVNRRRCRDRPRWWIEFLLRSRKLLIRRDILLAEMGLRF